MTTIDPAMDASEPIGAPRGHQPDPTRAPATPSEATSDNDPATERSEPKAAPRDQNLDTIKTLGTLLDDLEKVRIMNSNRVAALERDYGESLPHLDLISRQMKLLEHQAELELIRAWRKNPLAPWAKNYHGVGEKSIARLVAHIGNPGVRPNVAKLWAYCGHGDPARKRRKGMTQEEAFAMGNPAAKKQTWLIATALLKTGNRDVYDAARAHVADRVHEKPCVRCGPAGHPAAAGSPWSAGHQHAHALRVTGKAFLKDLWIAAHQR